METNYDAVIIGGAFSGASTALLLKRNLPSARVLIVEKSEVFDRKVGESTTEVSSCFLTKVLGLSTYLANHQLPKQGLRMWFTRTSEQCFSECVELGARYNSRLAGFQVDRATLDQHVLEMAVSEGCELMRPAKVTDSQLGGFGKNKITIQREGESLTINAKWVVDASGRVAHLARKLGHFAPLSTHPTSALWGRFRGVKDLDGCDLAKRFPEFANSCRTSRTMSTNHLMGYGWWLWIIPLKGGDTSIGLVYDERLFTPPEGKNIAERLRNHFMQHPVGREILADAEPLEGDTRAFSQLPYACEKVMGNGWACVGDAAGFLDPFYSPGLDFCAFTSHATQSIIARSLSGEVIDDEIGKYNERFRFCFDAWFEAIYLDKYHYIGDAELMAAAFLLDISSYHLGPVRQVFADPSKQFDFYPFDGKPGAVVKKFIAFYNRRLVVLAKKKMAADCYGDRNSHWRLLVGGFAPEPSIFKTLFAGLWRWALAEWRALWMRPKQPRKPEKIPMTNRNEFLANHEVAQTAKVGG